MRRTLPIQLLCVLLVTTSCAPWRLTRRYAGRELPAQPAQLVELTAFAMPVPAATPQATIAALSERAQAELVKALAAKTADAPALLAALAPVPPPAKPRLDLTQVSRRVVFSIENRSLRPGDRLDQAAIDLLLQDSASKPAFTSWSLFSTRYQTVDLGTVAAQQGGELTFTAKAAPATIEELAEASVTGKVTRNLQETLTLSRRFVEATGALSPQSARIIQQGAFGIDLTGNLFIDLSIRLGGPGDLKIEDVFLPGDLFDKSGKPVPLDKVTLSRKDLTYLLPRVCAPARADATLEAVLRKITRRDSSIAESDDRVKFTKASTTVPEVELVPAELLRATVWHLRDAGGNIVHIQNTPADLMALAFVDWDQASRFLAYLGDAQIPAGAPIAVAGRNLVLANQPLTQADVARLQVRIVKLNWRSGACAM